MVMRVAIPMEPEENVYFCIHSSWLNVS